MRSSPQPVEIASRACGKPHQRDGIGVAQDDTPPVVHDDTYVLLLNPKDLKPCVAQDDTYTLAVEIALKEGPFHGRRPTLQDPRQEVWVAEVDDHLIAGCWKGLELVGAKAEHYVLEDPGKNPPTFRWNRSGLSEAPGIVAAYTEHP